MINWETIVCCYFLHQQMTCFCGWIIIWERLCAKNCGVNWYETTYKEKWHCLSMFDITWFLNKLLFELLVYNGFGSHKVRKVL